MNHFSIPDQWPPDAQVVASLVLSSLGEFQIGGNAKGISNAEDRNSFLTLRTQADRIYTSYATLFAEGYSSSVDERLRVVTRQTKLTSSKTMSWEEFVANVLLGNEKSFIEFGPTLLRKMILEGLNFLLLLNIVSPNADVEQASAMLDKLDFLGHTSLQQRFVGVNLSGFGVRFGGSATN